MAKLGRLIETVEELKTNLNQVENYLNDSEDDVLDKIKSLIKNGKNFVAYQIENTNEIHFAPSRFIGYLNNSLKVHLERNNGKDGRETSPCIDKLLSQVRKYDDELEKQYLDFCSKLEVTPANVERKYWRLTNIKIELYEGGVKQVSANRYERNPEARRRCIEKHGTTCKVCGLNFKDMYGKIGDGFIHVHHIVPLSVQKEKRSVNEANLIPVCPNCHAMLHRGNISVEELQRIVKKNKD